MAITADYTVNLSDTSLTNVSTSTTGFVTNLGSTTWDTGSISNYHWHYSNYCSHCNPWYVNWTYPVQPEKVYMYQISCPKCEAKTFGELDTVIKCKKCKSTIKLVSKVTDYEVAVDL